MTNKCLQWLEDGEPPSPTASKPKSGQLPLTAQMMEKIMRELPEGTCCAIKRCYECAKANRFEGEEFLHLLKSVASQSPTITRMFVEETPNIRGAATAKQAASPTVKEAATVGPGAGVRGQSNRSTRRCGNAKCSDVQGGQEATTWGLAERRRHEARRLQLQKFQGTEACRLSSFLLDAVRRLAKQLPARAKGQLLQAVRQYSTEPVTPGKKQARLTKQNYS